MKDAESMEEAQDVEAEEDEEDIPNPTISNDPAYLHGPLGQRLPPDMEKCT